VRGEAVGNRHKPLFYNDLSLSLRNDAIVMVLGCVQMPTIALGSIAGNRSRQEVLPIGDVCQGCSRCRAQGSSGFSLSSSASEGG
jgi:hypothetical protein